MTTTTLPLASAASGWQLSSGDAWWFLAAWALLVLVYGLWRSRGDAPTDPIRPAGPTGLSS